MTTTSTRRLAATASALALGLTLSACAAANEEPASSGGGGAKQSGLSGSLDAGGASSQEAAQTAWRAGFQRSNPDVTVNYDPVGSGGGREGLISGGFLVAGSDSYLTDEEGELKKATQACDGQAPVEVPNYISPIAVIYNLEGVDELNLAPETLAGIFAGEITSWDDPAIAGDNPDADLPAEEINPVHRSDESGTTGNFTNYLSVAAPDAWTDGEVETWPIRGGEGASGTSGVVSAVTNSVNSIGYADASQAGDLGVANVGVGSEFVAPDPEAAAKIFEVSPRVEGRGEDSMVYDLDYTTKEAGTYPIVLTSYLMSCPELQGKEGDIAKAYMEYVVSDEGQQAASENAGSAPLPSEVASETQSIIKGITVG